MGQVFGSFASSTSSSMMPSASGSQSFSSGPSATSDTSTQLSEDHGRPFLEMVQGNDKYGPFLEVTTTYEIKIVHGSVLENLHWYILLKIQNSKLPYLTIEITTTNMSDLVPTIRTLELQQSPEHVGVYEKTLRSFCLVADGVVTQMGNYNLTRNNCQHFCNNLLTKLGHQTYPTTIGPETTLTDDDETKEFDLLARIMRPPKIIGKIGAKAVAGATGAPLFDE